MSEFNLDEIFDRLQNHYISKQLVEQYDLSLDVFGQFLHEALEDYLQGINEENENDLELVNEEISSELFDKNFFQYFNKFLSHQFSQQLHSVINATGIVINTQLGRSRLSQRSLKQMLHVGKHYSTLEYDSTIGQKVHRTNHIEEILQELTGAEAAMIVNNNSAAFYLIMLVLAFNKEVIVARGEVIDTGDLFKVAEAAFASGAILKEVGAVNQTFLHDYESNITDNTALILKVKSVNFRMVGMTEAVSNNQLFSLANKHNIISYENNGSGSLFDFSKFGLGNDETVNTIIKKGVDVLSFSGDKLMGGPQVGIILGKAHIIERLKSHPLSRAFRVDKYTLAALEGTLQEYNRGIKNVMKTIPTVRDIILPEKSVKQKAERLLQWIQREIPDLNVFVRSDHVQIGDAVMTSVLLSTYLLGIQTDKYSAIELDQKMRSGNPVIIGVIKNDMYWFDLRTVENAEMKHIVQALMKDFKS